MIKLGIIGAMELEVETLVGALEEGRRETRAGSVFYQGILEGLPVVIVRCGVGKVNAALCAQILCSCYQVTHLVNTGIAGALSPELRIGDLVVSRDAMYHDFDCRKFGYPFGMVPGLDVTAFPGAEDLIRAAYAAGEQVNPGHTFVGRVASGDQFIARQELKDQIIANTQAMCTEMEGAAIAQTAYRNGLPFVILRAISDQANDDAELDYPAFERTAAHRCARITRMMARGLAQQQDNAGSSE